MTEGAFWELSGGLFGRIQVGLKYDSSRITGRIHKMCKLLNIKILG